MLGQSTLDNMVSLEDAQWGPPRSAQSHADDWTLQRGRGVFPLALSEVAVEGMNLLAGSSRTVVYLNTAQIAGYIPGTLVEQVTGGAWSVAFSYGPCEIQRRDGISRMLARIQSSHGECAQRGDFP